MLQKLEGFRAKAPKVKVYLGTANPWQRRIWSPPAFPKGKKDGDKFTQSWTAPFVNFRNLIRNRFRCRVQKVSHGFYHLFYATLGLRKLGFEQVYRPDGYIQQFGYF